MMVPVISRLLDRVGTRLVNDVTRLEMPRVPGSYNK